MIPEETTIDVKVEDKFQSLNNCNTHLEICLFVKWDPKNKSVVFNRVPKYIIIARVALSISHKVLLINGLLDLIDRFRTFDMTF